MQRSFIHSYVRIRLFRTTPRFPSFTSLAKHSTSQPDGFSLDLPQAPPSAAQCGPAAPTSAPIETPTGGQFASQTSSRRSSYFGGQESLSTSTSGGGVGFTSIHSRIMRMTSNTSALSGVSGFSDDFQTSIIGDEDDEDGLLLTREPSNAERREYGQIRANVYLEYFRAGGFWFAGLFLFMSTALQGIKVYMDFLLRDWSLENEKNELSLSYFSSYLYFSLGVLALSCSANFLGQLIGARARRKLHSHLIGRLLRCSLDQLESRPLGTIISRLSYDFFVIDQKLPSAIQRLVVVAMICASALLVNTLASPFFLFFAVPAVIVYWWLQHFYRCSSRELQRLDSLTRAPVLSHFSDTLSGLVTIRAFREQSRFINQLCEKIDTNTTAFLILQSGCRWLGVALDFTGAFVVFVSVIVNMIFLPNFYPSDETLTAASIGLSMNYSLMVPIYLAWVVKFLADIENYMNAVERIVEYSDLAAEGDSTNEGRLEPVNEEGAKEVIQQIDNQDKKAILFDCVGLAHSHSRAVIQGLTLEILPGEKVGICGRSGSGKSTLLMGLARIATVLHGNITIDNVDVQDIPLKVLRRVAWTVPQDIAFFSGTLRSNLDPEEKHSDSEIWKSLDLLNLKGTVSELKDGLDAEVVENGENFSLGQKQELSLASAVLRNPPIVILDEATSALDATREVNLHKLLLKALQGSTVISVAHR